MYLILLMIEEKIMLLLCLFKSIGNNIKNLRIKNELSQENLANFLGVTQACIVRYEK